MSLQSKVFLFFSVLLVLILFEWFFFTRYERMVFKDEMKERGSLLTRALAELSKEPILSYRITQLEKQIDSIRNERDVINARIYNASYLVLASSDRKWEGWFFTGKIAEDTRIRFFEREMVVQAPIVIMGKVWGMAEVTFSLSAMMEKIGKSRLIFLVIFLVELVLAVLFAIFLEFQVVSPLNSLSGELKAIEPESLLKPIKGYDLATPEIMRVVSSLEDMKAKLKSAQEELVSKTQMATFVQIATNIAHEIRNPLEAISGAVEVISGEEKISGPSKESLAIIREEIQNLNDYLGRFLDITKPEPIKPVSVDMNRLIDDCILLMKPLFKKKGITVKRNSGEVADVKCSVDINQIKRVIINLLLNSVESIEKDGTIEVSVLRERGEVIITVRDSGRGIAEENIRKVFDPYFTTKRGGSGIGLSLSKNIVESHGGKIIIESTRGRGTTVNVFLPCGE